MYIIIFMAYIFNLFHVVAVVYNGDSCFYFENIERSK
jgi:hypothetical protein